MRLTRLPRLLPLLLAGLALPAHAQMSLSLDSTTTTGSSSASSSVGLSLDTPSSSSAALSLASSSAPAATSSSASEPMSSEAMSSAPMSSEEMSSQDMTSDETTSEDTTGEDTGGDEVPSGPPVTSREALTDFYAACNLAASGVVGATQQLEEAGWTANEANDVGPFNSVYSGYRTFGGLGDVDIWGALQSFPTQRLGYCRVDFSDQDLLIDFKDMSGLGELTGKLEDRGSGNVFGTWESADKHVLVLADRVDSTVEIEFNFLLGDAPKS